LIYNAAASEVARLKERPVGQQPLPGNVYTTSVLSGGGRGGRKGARAPGGTFKGAAF